MVTEEEVSSFSDEEFLLDDLETSETGNSEECNKKPIKRKESSQKNSTSRKKHAYDPGELFYNSQQLRDATQDSTKPTNIINPLPVNSNTHIFMRNHAVSREAIMADAFTLLGAYLLKEKRNFAAFQETWLERQFQLIHFACPDRTERQVFMLGLYQTFMTFLYRDAVLKFPIQNVNPLELKLGVLFALYMLYLSQPSLSSNERCRISVDPNQWGTLNQLYQCFGSQELWEGVYIFGKLKEEGAFLLKLYLDHRPAYYQHNRLNASINHVLDKENETEDPQQLRDQLRLTLTKNHLDRLEYELQTQSNYALSAHLQDLNDLEESYRSKALNLCYDMDTKSITEDIERFLETQRENLTKLELECAQAPPEPMFIEYHNKSLPTVHTELHSTNSPEEQDYTIPSTMDWVDQVAQQILEIDQESLRSYELNNIIAWNMHHGAFSPKNYPSNDSDSDL